jgi:hypothetical protein
MKFKLVISAALVAAVGFVAPAANAAETEKFVVFQDAPVIVDHPDPDFEANKIGHVFFFAGDLRNVKSKKIGELIGQVTTFDVTLEGVEDEDRFRELVFNMVKGQIVVLGASQYVASSAPDFANDNAAVTAVVVGGTGDYVGVRGTVTTKKRPNGTFRHTFRLMR